MTEIKVSIFCTTYNHRNYIGKALESFLMQKTDFQYEILVHDDASTDGTADIIQDYAARYPDRIIPVLQTENQFSKGHPRAMKDHLEPLAHGEFAAFCEGDDYWTDPNKLQKQVDILERHPECSFSVHAARYVTHDTEEFLRYSPLYPNHGDKILHFNESARIFFPTASILCRLSFLKESPRDWFLETGDYALRAYLLSRGDVYYIDEVLSAYRFHAPGCATLRLAHDKDKTKNQPYFQDRVRFYEEFDRDTGGKFHHGCMEGKYFAGTSYVSCLKSPWQRVRQMIRFDRECWPEIPFRKVLRETFYGIAPETFKRGLRLKWKLQKLRHGEK